MTAVLGAWWNNAPLVQEAFGGRIADVETMRRASQWLQYDGLRYAVEANLRRTWSSSGVLPWQLNESFPNAWCTSAVDWLGEPKPVFAAVARALAGRQYHQPRPLRQVLNQPHEFGSTDRRDFSVRSFQIESWLP